MPNLETLHRALLIIDGFSQVRERYAIYGVGAFTRRLAPMIRAAGLPLPEVYIDDDPRDLEFEGRPVVPVAQCDIALFDQVVLGTDTYQQAMREKHRQAFGTAQPTVDVTTWDMPAARSCTALDNIFHCCAHKTASRWVLALLSDPIVQASCGLKPYDYQDAIHQGLDMRPIMERRFDQPFPLGRIVSPLYISLPGYHSIIKPPALAGDLIPALGYASESET